MEFYIEDSLHYKIQDYCNYNNLDTIDYIGDCIVKQFNIDRYGDLNVIIENRNKKEEIQKDFELSEISFDEKNQHYVLKHNLGNDIIIPLSKFMEIENNPFIKKKDESKISEVSTEKEINTNKTKKRTLQTR